MRTKPDIARILRLRLASLIVQRKVCYQQDGQCHGRRKTLYKAVLVKLGVRMFTVREAHYATSTTAPPTSLIFFSASLDTNLALTTTGCEGSCPLPSTFMQDRADGVNRMRQKLLLAVTAGACQESVAINNGPRRVRATMQSRG